MAEERNQFKSIYGDEGSEFEIEDVSDETLSIPAEEVRAVRDEEIAADIDAVEDRETLPAEENADISRDPLAEGEETDETVSDEGQEPFPDEETEPYSEEDIEGVTFGDADVLHEHQSVSGQEQHERYEDADDDHGSYDEDGDQDSDEEDPEEERISILSYLGHAVLFTIPIIGTILMLIYIIDEDRNPRLHRFAGIWLVTLLVIMVGVGAALYMFGLA